MSEKFTLTEGNVRGQKKSDGLLRLIKKGGAIPASALEQKPFGPPPAPKPSKGKK